MAGTTLWDAPFKQKNRTNTRSLSTLNRMYGSWTDVKEVRQSELVDSSVISSDSVGMSAFS